MLIGVAILLILPPESVSIPANTPLGFDLSPDHELVESTDPNLIPLRERNLFSESIPLRPTRRSFLQEHSTTTGQACDNINTASAPVLQRVSGIGAVKAQAIIDYRNQHGPFTSLDELARVKGIGSATIENFRRAGFCVPESNSDGENTAATTEATSNEPDTSNNQCDNLNAASTLDLQRVRGIGTVKAQAIIDYRNQHGPFTSLDELTRVRGIGPATLENFRSAGFCVLESKGEENTSDRSTQTSSNQSYRPDQNCNNVNHANATDLQRIRGIGTVKAQAIIDYRSQNGLFNSLSDLIQVRGIGPATLENVRRAGFCVQESTNTSERSDLPTSDRSTHPTATSDNCLDINTADATELQRVKGIGSVKAQTILDFRNSRGAFRSLNSLLEVRGIGPATIRNFQESGFCVGKQTSQLPPGESLPNHTNSMSPTLPYDRSLYGYWWDEDGDCQNTRDEVLIAKSRTEVDLDDTGCIVLAGEWLDPYVDSVFTDPREIDIDHFVPIAEVHRSGGAKWNYEDRVSYTNDLSENGTLIPVSAAANRSKGDRDPTHWLPPNEAFHCQYVGRWVNLKNIWKLTMDYAEQQAIKQIQTTCESGSDRL